MISVIIPTFNEEAIIRGSLEDIHRPQVCGEIPFQVIVCDARSTDRTVEEVADFQGRTGNPVTLVESPLGRGLQMNRGAEEAIYLVLLFLHADVSLPEGAFEAIRMSLQDPSVVGGGFLKSYREKSWKLAINVLLTRIRAVCFKSFWGNDCIFVRRSAFRELGGYQCWPILEDVDFSKRMRKLGKTVAIRKHALASARRYLRRGILLQGMRNLKILFAYWLGKDPSNLKKWY